MGEAIIDLKTNKKTEDVPINQMLSINLILTQKSSCKMPSLKKKLRKRFSFSKRLGLIFVGMTVWFSIKTVSGRCAHQTINR